VPPPRRRSSAIELSALGDTHYRNNSYVGVATLGVQSMVPGGAGNMGMSRSAATSPVGGATSSLPLQSGGSQEHPAGQQCGSPRLNRTSNEAWVCPNDRQLALRAKYVN
jgi:hypothetical protein